MSKVEITVRRFFTTPGGEINISPSASFVTDLNEHGIDSPQNYPALCHSLRATAEEAIKECTDFAGIRDMTPEEVAAYRADEVPPDGVTITVDGEVPGTGPDDGDELG